MFNNEIRNDLTCDICNAIYIELKMLPCNHTLCDKCINESKDKNELECPICSQIHQIPNHGFPKNDLKQNQQQKKPKLSLEQFDYKQLRNELEDKLKQLEFDLNNGDYVISEHCRELKRSVQLAKEIKMKQMNEIFDNLLLKIDTFEKASLKSYSSINKTKFQTDLNNLNESIQNWTNKLNQNNADLEKVISELKLIETQLKLEQEELKFATFNGELLNYRENKIILENNLFGSLVSYPFKTLKFNELEQIDYGNHLYRMSMEYIEYFRKYGADEFLDSQVVNNTGFLLNGDFIVLCEFYDGENYDLNMFQFNESRKLKRLKTIECIEGSSIRIKSNKICLFYEKLRKYHRREVDKKMLTILDQDLETQKEIETNIDKIIGADEDKIYCLIDDTKPLLIYNWSLEIVDQIGQYSDPKELFYFNKESSDLISVKNGSKHLYLIIFNGNINIMDQLSGVVLKTISYDNKYTFFRVLFDHEMLNIIITDEKEIIYYDLNGNYLKQVDVINKPEHGYGVWSLGRFNNLYYFDNKYILHI